MFAKFKYERIALSLIKLDEKNPRIVTLEHLKSQEAIVEYLFEHEALSAFLKKIATEGRNQGAERPYIVKSGKEYVVVEGNTRIAAYKLLTGQLKPPEHYASAVPHLPGPIRDELLSVDCTIAPSRDALLPIMAAAHFGLGDKSKWGYLGSRKAVYDEWKGGKSIAQLATAFDRKKGQINDLILEYKLYLAALKFDWTPAEKQILTDPAVEFNPPVRFLQGTGHRSAIGIELDRVNHAINFEDEEAKAKFRHLVKKLVISSEKGFGATSSYKDVFSDYPGAKPESDDTAQSGADGSNGSPGADDKSQSENNQKPGDKSSEKPKAPKLTAGALFNYPVTANNLLLKQLMKECKAINANKLPASATALLRSTIEAILKTIIEDQGANPKRNLLSLETALDICLGNTVQLGVDDRKILKEFKKNHLDYVNLGAHATVVPNALRLMAARDCVDQFVMRNI
ncbi:hypothetical protein ABVF61_18970 [Roseibium sp. HPY-6]|uniref:hypothetical protein n=1 Tax=Roseibium sp. HPY-6 TaxID=3229852 RepID=UPI00338FEE9E